MKSHTPETSQPAPTFPLFPCLKKGAKIKQVFLLVFLAFTPAPWKRKPKMPAAPDKLTTLSNTAARARDIELQLADLANQQKELSEELRTLYSVTLPELLDDVELDHIGVPPSGNKPGVDYELKSYYSASIASSWEPSRRQAAFDLLKRCKAESLIKTEVTARLPKGNLAAAKKIFAVIKKMKVKGAVADLKQSVHANTLGAWLRELYETHHQSLPQADLDKIGASVGRVVRPKERKEDN